MRSPIKVLSNIFSICICLLYERNTVLRLFHKNHVSKIVTILRIARVPLLGLFSQFMRSHSAPSSTHCLDRREKGVDNGFSYFRTRSAAAVASALKRARAQ